MMDSVPQSPNPNLTRTGSPATSTPERAGSPIKGLTYTKAATPVQAETSNVSAKGENGLWDDDEAGPSIGKGQGSRARRELSVIDESIQRDEEAIADEASLDPDIGEVITEPTLDDEPDTENDQPVDVRHDTEDELDETEEEDLPDKSSEDADDGVSEGKLDNIDSNLEPAVPA